MNRLVMAYIMKRLSEELKVKLSSNPIQPAIAKYNEWKAEAIMPPISDMPQVHIVNIKEKTQETEYIHKGIRFIMPLNLAKGKI